LARPGRDLLDSLGRNCFATGLTSPFFGHLDAELDDFVVGKLFEDGITAAVEEVEGGGEGGALRAIEEGMAFDQRVEKGGCLVEIGEYSSSPPKVAKGRATAARSRFTSLNPGSLPVSAMMTSCIS